MNRENKKAEFLSKLTGAALLILFFALLMVISAIENGASLWYALLSVPILSAFNFCVDVLNRL